MILLCSRTELSRLRRSGAVLTVREMPNGEFVYDALSVCRAKIQRGARATRTDHELELLAFKLFERGATLAECIEELGLRATLVRDLYEQWRTPLEKKQTERARQDDEALREKKRADARAEAARRREQDDREARARAKQLEKQLED